MRNKSTNRFDILGHRPGSTCASSVDFGNCSAKITAYAPTSVYAAAPATTMRKAHDLAKVINNFSDSTAYIAGGAAVGAAGLVEAGAVAVAKAAEAGATAVAETQDGSDENIEHATSMIQKIVGDMISQYGIRIDFEYTWKICVCESVETSTGLALDRSKPVWTDPRKGKISLYPLNSGGIGDSAPEFDDAFTSLSQITAAQWTRMFELVKKAACPN